MTKNQSLNLEEDVKKDLSNGFTIGEIAKKYGVSEYFIKKWTREVYKKIDIDMLVRRRYSRLVCDVRSQLEADLSMLIPDKSRFTDEDLEMWDEIIKKALYDFAKNIVQKN